MEAAWPLKKESETAGFGLLRLKEKAMKTVCVCFPNGCPRAMMEAARLVDYFRLNGWLITTKLPEADLVLVGVCGVTADMERSSLKYLAIVDRRKKKDAPFVVFGCLPGINAAIVPSCYHAITITKKNLDVLDSLTQASIKVSEVKHPNDADSYSACIHQSFSLWDQFLAKNKFKFTGLAAFKLYARILRYHHQRPEAVLPRSNDIHYIKIARGCNGLCSYCAIKSDAGSLISRPLADLRAEFEKGLAQGAKVIRLVAEDVGSYGQDIGLTIVDLFEELFSLPGDYQVFIDDFSPKWLVRYCPELLDIFKRHVQRIGYLGLAIQSGSERILDLMNREYQAAQAKDCILAVKEACSNLQMHTHVLLGFPRETEEDFLDTLNFLKTVNFRRVTIYSYSDRPNTLSSTFPDKVPEKVKMNRAYRLIKALEGTAYLAG